MSALLRVSAQPEGWSACRARGRRRPVMAWAVFAEDGGLVTVAGLVAEGEKLVRGDRLPGFVGWSPGAGCEPQPEAPPLPPASLNEAVTQALAVDAGSWSGYESRIRANLLAASSREFATVALASFVVDPIRWFRLWSSARREREETEDGLRLRLRALAAAAPGRDLEAALADAGLTLGALLAAPDPNRLSARRGPGGGE